ncbi:MAG TPA: DUF5060 domain-containing protein, partial [Chloroflexia bacterium]|nr:DUF5060 domain-containing protein [Chloroflexia bacterium]
MKRKVNRSIKLAGLLVTGLLIAQVLSACSNSAEPTSTPGPVTTQAAVSPVTTQASATTQPATATPTAQPAPITTASRSEPSATPSVAAVPPEIKSVTPDASQIGRYNKLELTVDLKASYNNPFDPAQVDLHAVFTAPGGSSKTVPGFYWQDYTSQLSNQKEVLTPKGQAAWKVRFSPDSEGDWTYYVEVVTPGGTARTNPAKVKVVSSTNPGFLRVSSQDNSYLEFSNGQPYFAIGQNVGWYGEGGSHDY